MREITIPTEQLLPALSTAVPERSYGFVGFINDYIARAKPMREDENLTSMFQLGDWLSLQTDWTPGKTVTMSDDLWSLVKDVAKSEIDAAMMPDQNGAIRLPVPWSFGVLKHYYSLAFAKQVSDIKHLE